jgi:hypothetical protein
MPDSRPKRQPPADRQKAACRPVREAAISGMFRMSVLAMAKLLPFAAVFGRFFVQSTLSAWILLVYLFGLFLAKFWASLEQAGIRQFETDATGNATINIPLYLAFAMIVNAVFLAANYGVIRMLKRGLTSEQFFAKRLSYWSALPGIPTALMLILYLQDIHYSGGTAAVFLALLLLAPAAIAQAIMGLVQNIRLLRLNTALV